jgi:hypothetical protein
MPSMAQHEATIPVEVFVVQSDANGLFQKTIHIAQPSVQNNGVAEVDSVPCIDTVLCHCRLIQLIEADVSPMFLASRLDGSPCLAHVYLATFAWNSVHAKDIQT